jgi:aryl-alcohol dehydrogenase
VIDTTAALLREPKGKFTIEAVQLDEPAAGEVLVRIAGTGICHTDLSARSQYFPFPLPAILGHEGAGVVEKVGSGVRKVRPGDHVVLTLGTCGECPECRAAQAMYCANILPLNLAAVRLDTGAGVCRTKGGEKVSGLFFSQSSFAAHALAREGNVVKIPNDVPLELMGPLACGMQTGAGAVMNVLKPAASSSLAVFGAGSVGMAAIMAAKIVGCGKIIAVDLNDERLALARELGATHSVNAKAQSPVTAIQEITGDGVHYSIECTSIPAVLRQSVDALRKTGTCVILGAPPFGTEVSLDVNTLLQGGRSVRGSIEGDSNPDVFIPQLIEFWRSGVFPFDRLVKFYPLQEINQAIADTESGAVLKPVLRPG